MKSHTPGLIASKWLKKYLTLFLTKYIFATNSKDRGFETSYRRQHTSQLNSEGVKVSPTFRTSIS